MSSDDTAHIDDERISSLTGEFRDPRLERRYRHIHWGEQSRQVRIVCLISIFAYLFAFYQNYLDLGAGGHLWVIAACRLAQFATLGWAIYLSYAPTLSSPLQYAVFAAEIVTGISETLEMLQYHQAGLLTDITAVPFFAFIILIYYMFLPIRWGLTTIASLIGSTVMIAGYAYAVHWHFAHIIRHPVVLLGVIAIGAGVVRVMNRGHRRNWLQGRKLEAEIGERRRAEAKALEASRVKGEFLAVMSHEIRTPLNSILAMTEVLSSDAALQGERSRRQLDVLATAGRHLNELVNEILDFSRLEANIQTIANAPFDLRSTLEQSTGAIQNLAFKKGITLNVAIDSTLPGRFLGDGQRIRQILINLIGNAIKFTDAGQVEVAVGWSETVAGAVRVTVSDTGVGIPPEDLSRIFEPFRQSDASSTRQYQGTGLGLAITQNLVEQMGGRIEARNRPTGGTVFEFFLPLPVVEEHALPLDDSAPSLKVNAPTIPFNALVVEDSELNRIVIEEYLTGVPCSLQFAVDGRQGIEAFKAETFDIVLMDLQMPGMDGITATRVMREWEHIRGGEPTPIVITTADNQNETRRLAESAGVSGYLTKPMSRAELFHALNRHIKTEIESTPTSADAGNPLETLLPRYLAQMEQDLLAMAQALEREEVERLGSLAHAAKGHSQMFGFLRVAEAASALETAARAATRATPSLHTAWETLRTTFASEAESRHAGQCA